MNDYEPLDISALCNAGAEVLRQDEVPLTGQQSLRGLPFLIGPEQADSGTKNLVALDGSSDSVTVIVGQTARNVIFAHRLQESDLHNGGPLANHIADYVFHLAGGQEVRVHVRERFEIGFSHGDFFNTGQPYLAVSDQNDHTIPRHEGIWEEAGRRQTEAMKGNTLSYYLWAWQNPNPDAVIESIEIQPKGPGFLIAAVTLGHADEYPFVRQGRREARILL